MPDILQTVIPYIVAGLFLAALILFLLALRYFRKGKRGPYWRIRRTASMHGWQLFIISLTLVFVGSAVCLFTGFATAVLEGVQPTAGSPVVVQSVESPAEQEIIVITATPQAVLTTTAAPSPTVEPSPRPAVTVSVSPAASDVPDVPSAEPSGLAVTVEPLEAPVTASPDADLQITAVDDALSGELQPVHDRDTLPAGITRIYFQMAYDGMAEGVAWERVLLRDGVVVQGGAYLWAGPASGDEVYFFGDTGGFLPGDYEIRLSLSGETVTIRQVTLEVSG